jgi:hypothetical protein
MRMPLLLACFIVITPVMAASPKCKVDEPLSLEQRQAVVKNDARGDPLVLEAIALEHAKSPDFSHQAGTATPVTWQQAQKLIWLGAARTVFQHRDLSVTIISSSGRKFTTREPRLGDAWDAVAKVDPCGIDIIKVAE